MLLASATWTEVAATGRIWWIPPFLAGPSVIPIPPGSSCLERLSSFYDPPTAAETRGRNTFYKGAIRNVNAALFRRWVIAGERSFLLRAESINFLNTPQFAEPGFELSNPSFGAITNTLNDGRTFRVRAEFGW